MSLKSIAAALALSVCCAMTALAGPGAALTLDVIKAISDDGKDCKLLSPSPHVTVLYINGPDIPKSTDGKAKQDAYEAAKAKTKKELDRFETDVKAYVKTMIAETLAEEGRKEKTVEFMNGVFDKDIFKNPKNPMSGYTPGPVVTKVLKRLNGKLNDFIAGTYRPAGEDDSKEKFDKYELEVAGTTTKANYTPHMSVSGPSVYAGTQTPVKKVTAILNQALTFRKHPSLR